jgi:hypothetical protein
VARYDKYEPFAGGFRALLAADFGYTAGVPDRNHADLGKPFGVGLDANGLLVKGSGVTGVKGVCIIDLPKAAGDVVDTMSSGEILEWETTAGVAGVAAHNYYAHNTTGVVAPGTGAGGVTPPATSTYLGFTAEVTTTKGARFIARVGTRPATAV